MPSTTARESQTKVWLCKQCLWSQQLHELSKIKPTRQKKKTGMESNNGEPAEACIRKPAATYLGTCRLVCGGYQKMSFKSATRQHRQQLAACCIPTYQQLCGSKCTKVRRLANPPTLAFDVWAEGCSGVEYVGTELQQ